MTQVKVLHKEKWRLDQEQDFHPMMVESLSVYWSPLATWVLVNGKRGIQLWCQVDRGYRLWVVGQ